jgi:hypothetical protein
VNNYIYLCFGGVANGLHYIKNLLAGSISRKGNVYCTVLTWNTQLHLAAGQDTQVVVTVAVKISEGFLEGL